MDPRQTADELAHELAARGSTQRADKERTYLKSDLDHFGVSVPEIRRVATRFGRAHPSLDHDELVDLVVALWDVEVHERRMVAIELLDQYRALLTPMDVPLLERLVRETGTWALLDGLAAKVMGSVRERWPVELDTTLAAWAVDPDRWVRRASLLTHLVPLREGRGDFEVFGRLAEKMLDDRDPFIRKAIGWVLRDTSRLRPELVIAWLEPRARHMARPALREAVKHLPSGDRERLIQTATHNRNS